jgi:hypothetical protein
MPSEFPMNDPRNLWQNQQTEKFKMSVTEMRRRAHKSQSRARLSVLVQMVIGLFLCVGFAWSFARTTEVISRMGWGLLSVWAVFFSYQVYKWVWPREVPTNAPAGTSVEYYRNELERQRDYVQHVWWRSGLTFCFLGLALVLGPPLIKALQTPRMLLNAVPFFALLAVWLAMVFPMQRRRKQRLNQEIEELRSFEGNAG